MWLLFTFILVMAFLAIINFVLSWAVSFNREGEYIKFDDFKRLYEMNPRRFRLYYDEIIYDSSCHESFSLKLNFIDYCEYRLFRYSIKRNQKRMEKDESHNSFLKAIERDFKE